MKNISGARGHGSALAGIAILALYGCSGDGATSNNAPPATYSISASVSGLDSGALGLSVNGNAVTVAEGSTSSLLASGLSAGASYAVTVQVQPTGEACSVSQGSGVISVADVANVVITCSVQSFSLGGTITGLANSGLVLGNGADSVAVLSGASDFTLPSQVAYASSYAVSVQTQPPGLACSVSQGSGLMPAAAVSTVMVACTDQPFSIAGSIAGLGNNAGLTLTNGADTVTVAVGATSFAMPLPVVYGSTYSVAVGSSPAGLTCSVANGSGTMGAANVTAVAVTCADEAYSIRGTITGLYESGLTLDNGSDTVSVSQGATSFVLDQPVA